MPRLAARPRENGIDLVLATTWYLSGDPSSKVILDNTRRSLSDNSSKDEASIAFTNQSLEVPSESYIQQRHQQIERAKTSFAHSIARADHLNKPIIYIDSPSSSIKGKGKATANPSVQAAHNLEGRNIAICNGRGRQGKEIRRLGRDGSTSAVNPPFATAVVFAEANDRISALDYNPTACSAVATSGPFYRKDADAVQQHHSSCLSKRKANGDGRMHPETDRCSDSKVCVGDSNVTEECDVLPKPLSFCSHGVLRVNDKHPTFVVGEHDHGASCSQCSRKTPSAAMSSLKGKAITRDEVKALQGVSNMHKPLRTQVEAFPAGWEDVVDDEASLALILQIQAESRGLRSRLPSKKK